MFESPCCYQGSYFPLLCIGGIEQQRLLGREKMGFLWSLLWLGRVGRHNSGSPYILSRPFPPGVGSLVEGGGLSLQRSLPLPFLGCNRFKMGRSDWGGPLRSCLMLSNLGTVDEKWEKEECCEQGGKIPCATCPSHKTPPPGTGEGLVGRIHVISHLCSALPGIPNTMTHQVFLLSVSDFPFSHSPPTLSWSCKLPQHQNTESSVPGFLKICFP